MSFPYSIALIAILVLITCEPVVGETEVARQSEVSQEATEALEEYFKDNPELKEAFERLLQENPEIFEDSDDPIATAMLALSVLGSGQAIDRFAEAVCQPEVCQPIAEAVARLCQGEHQLYDRWDTPFGAFVPEMVLPVRSDVSVVFRPDQAKIMFGGGFHHFGYILNRSTGLTADTNQWSMYWYDEFEEDSPLLYTFTLDKNDHVTREQFIENTLSAYDRLLREKPTDWYIENRIHFLLRVNRPDLVQQIIRDSMNQPDAHWLERSLAVIIDPPADTKPADALETWAREHNGYRHWLIVAYTYHHLGRIDDMERCAKLALETGPPESHSAFVYNVRAASLAMAVYLHEAGRQDTCTRLCEARLMADEEDDYLVDEYHAILTGNPQQLSRDHLLYPFKNIDLEKIREK